MLTLFIVTLILKFIKKLCFPPSTSIAYSIFCYGIYFVNMCYGIAFFVIWKDGIDTILCIFYDSFQIKTALTPANKDYLPSIEWQYEQASKFAELRQVEVNRFAQRFFHLFWCTFCRL